jgi:hypothetical protein
MRVYERHYNVYEELERHRHEFTLRPADTAKLKLSSFRNTLSDEKIFTYSIFRRVKVFTFTKKVNS